MKKKVVIVGGGVAGLFAAYELAKSRAFDVTIVEMGANASERKCPLERYKMCTRCKPCNIMSGVGGAGLFSSGLLNLHPRIGGDLVELVGSEKRAWDLVEYVDQIFVECGAPTISFKPDEAKVEELERKAASAGITFIPIVQRLIGTENAKRVIEKLEEKLKSKGVKFILRTKAVKVGRNEVLLSSGVALHYDYCVLAPGRSGMRWLAEQMAQLNVKTSHVPVDIGVRVEVPATIMEPICSIQRDPKFHIYTSHFDDFVRTFCVNHHGYVVMEVYEDHVGVNGHSFLEKPSPNTNFALLSRIELTEPLEDTTAYGNAIARQTTILGGGRPLLQKLGDLRKGRRSTWKRIKLGAVRPTLDAATPGDLSMGLPHRILTSIIEGIEKLDKVIPGIASDSTLLYAPEIKYSAKKVITGENLETAVENLFVAGDGAGLSRGIVGAAATGIIAARGILGKEGVEAA
ncbi:MAG: NAD(P)/FAD-dependent oxidoreductase [Candidatus Freyarchaeota archaeon]|nr:NAD(P)/FAD-dependent oxidoreductase [Candidatus Freyrarchaeum guaymaensis]